MTAEPRDLGILGWLNPGIWEFWEGSTPGFGNPETTEPPGKSGIPTPAEPRDLGTLGPPWELGIPTLRQNLGIWECWHHWEFPNLDGHRIRELGIPKRRHHRENREFRAGIGIKTPIPVKSRHCSASSSRIPGRIPGKGWWGGRIPWEGGTGASQRVFLWIREPEIPKKFPPG